MSEMTLEALRAMGTAALVCDLAEQVLNGGPAAGAAQEQLREFCNIVPADELRAALASTAIEGAGRARRSVPPLVNPG